MVIGCFVFWLWPMRIWNAVREKAEAKRERRFGRAVFLFSTIKLTLECFLLVR